MQIPSASSPRSPQHPPKATSCSESEEDYILIPDRSTFAVPPSTAPADESPMDKIRSVLAEPCFREDTSEYISNIRQALDANDPNRIIGAITENFHTQSLTHYEHTIQLLYCCARLMREQAGNTAPQNNPKYDRIISLLKANPYSGFECWVQEKHFAMVREILNSSSSAAEVKHKMSSKASAPESAIDPSAEDFFKSLEPNRVPPRLISQEFTFEEKEIYAKKFGYLLATDTVQKSVEKFEKRILSPLLSYARSQFLAANPALIDSSEFRRGSDTRFAVDASSARTYKEGVGNGALINHYDQLNVGGHIERLRCGAIHTENAAKQYVLKMLLENIRQASSGETITLLDSRYLDVMNPLFGDVGKLKKHRKLIEKVINQIAPHEGRISFDRMQEMITELSSSQLIQDEQAEEMLEAIAATKGKKVEFISLDLGATPKSRLQDALVWDDKKTIQQLHHLQELFTAKLSGHTSTEISQLLIEFQAILDLYKSKFSRGKSYISGHRAFQLDELIARLSLACGMVSSAGCMSNKDRGSSAYLFHCIAEKVFEHQTAQAAQLLEQGQPIPGHFFSLKDFHLISEEEKQIARDAILTNPGFLVTLFNTSFGGIKCARLDWVIEEAFDGDKTQVKAFNQMQSHGKLAKN